MMKGENSGESVPDLEYMLKDHLGNVRVMLGENGTKYPSTLDIKSYNNNYAFGAPHPFRNFNLLDQRHAFNGQEKPNEIKGVGLHYSFKAREYDPVYGRWWSLDPLARKYPHESPYLFSGDSPIMFMDPDGQEKVIVIGGGDGSGKDRYKFVNSGLKQLIEYAKNNTAQEPITMVVTNKFIDQQTYDYMQQWANSVAINYNLTVNIVFAEAGDEITNYVNSKNTSIADLGIARIADPITSLSFFGHGYLATYSSQPGASSFEPGHGSEGEESSPGPCYINAEHNRWVWGIQDVAVVDPSAFSMNSVVDFYSCNAATPSGPNSISLARALSIRLGGKTLVSGYFGKTDYVSIYNGKGFLGTLSKMFNGGRIPAVNFPKAGTKSDGHRSTRSYFRSGQYIHRR